MKEKINYRIPPDFEKIPKNKIHISRVFTENIHKEFGNFISAVILFGSTARNLQRAKDIDILIVLDDVRVKFTRELTETYRILTEKAMARASPNNPQLLHVQSMTLTSFWEYVRAGDPVAINILRDGIALIDSGFFSPLQLLLREGRIRPSEEAVHNYYTMASSSILRSKQNMLNATLDLYWATIDAAHAALMTQGEVPPSPSHITEVFHKRLVRTNIIPKKYEHILQTMYALSRKITHREIREITGKDYDKYRKMTDDFVKAIKRFLEKR